MPLAKSEDGLLVEFFIDAVPQGAESEKAGRPIFKDVEHVRIIVPGDNRTEVVRVATDADKERFGRIYEHFKSTGEKSAVGTPIEEWPTLSKSQAKELKGVGFRTVEQLATVTGAAHEHLPPEFKPLVPRAQAFLAQAGGTSDVQRFASENETLRGENERLQAEIQRLAGDLRSAREAKPAQVQQPARR